MKQIPTLLVIAVTSALLSAVGYAQTDEQPATAFDQPDPATQLKILSDTDIARYTEIFRLQEGGKWPQADALIGKLGDDILMGHVQFQRFMHPTKYRSAYGELREWMSHYADHPEAQRIYRLAMHRKPKKYKAPAKPIARIYKPPEDISPPPPPTVSEEVRKRNRASYLIRSRISAYLRKGRVEQAEKRLWSAETADIFDELPFDTQLSRIANSYYYKGKIEKALALGSMAAERSVDQLPEANWVAGLAAWKLKKWSIAAEQFRAVQASPESNSWLRSAGGFWAARAYIRIGKPELASDMLHKASKEKRTFYGLLALRQTGEVPEFSWDRLTAEADHVNFALSNEGIRRAIAMQQIGKDGEADREFLGAHRRLPPGHNGMLLPVAMSLDLHGSQAKLSRLIINESDTAIDAALYPVPSWQPQDGYKLDRAFLFAVMRQESAFSPMAVSYAGASGLMQLMPATAAYIYRDNSLRKKNRRRLFDPEFNMLLGQKYLNYLFTKKVTEANIMLVFAAYNAGPGNIAKWKQRTGHGDDWLLFMESIPNRQNRNYVERVMANLWIYRLRLGQAAPSLDNIASGLWPRYAALDNRTAANTQP